MKQVNKQGNSKTRHAVRYSDPVYGRWRYTVLQESALKKRPPKGQLWLRLLIFRAGVEYRRYTLVPRKSSFEAVKMIAERFRKSIYQREGI